MRKHALTLVATAALTLPLFIQPAAAQLQRTVTYRDLDIADAQDAAVLVERLDAASRAVCGGSPRSHANYRVARVEVTRAFEACRAQAMDAALAQIDAPAVTRAHAYAARADARRS